MSAVTARSVGAEGYGRGTYTGDDIASNHAPAIDRQAQGNSVQPQAGRTGQPQAGRTGQPQSGGSGVGLGSGTAKEVSAATEGGPVVTPSGRRRPAETGSTGVDAPMSRTQWAPAPRSDDREEAPPASTVVAAQPVGFSPTGDVLPASLVEVLATGSHAIHSANRAEQRRRERADAIATHVDRQIAEFLAICTAKNLSPAVPIRIAGDAHIPAPHSRRRRRPPPGGASTGEAPNGNTKNLPTRGFRPGEAGSSRRQRRAQSRTWPVLYWRSESFPFTGRSLHLFLAPDGATFEGREDPRPRSALGGEVPVWPVDVHVVVGAMYEVDARRCAHQLVYSLAHLLWRAGIGV